MIRAMGCNGMALTILLGRENFVMGCRIGFIPKNFVIL